MEDVGGLVVDSAIRRKTMGRSRTARVLAGLGATVIRHLLDIADRFLLVPLFLANWGGVRYGEWLALAAGAGALAMLNLGMHTYVINRLRQCYATGQIADFNSHLHSGLRLALVSFTVGLLGVTVMAVLAPVGSWIGLKQTGRFTASVTILLLAVNVLAQIPLGLVRGVYRSVAEYGREGMVGNAMILAQIVLTAAALVAKRGFAEVALAHLIPVWLGTAFAALDIRARHPEVVFGVRQGSWGLALRMLSPSLLFLLMSLAHALTSQGSVLVLSVWLGGAAVVLFSTTGLLANAVMKLSSIAQGAVWPEFTALQAENQLAKLRELHIGLVKVCLMATLSGAVAIYFAGPDLYRLWVRRQVDFDPLLMTLLLGYVTTASVWQASAVVAMSSNKHRVVVVRYVLAGVAAVGLCILLVPVIGVYGAVIGLWGADLLIRVFSIPNSICRLLDDRPLRFWWEAVLRGAPAVAVSASLAVGVNELTRGSWLNLLLVPAIAMGGMGVMGFFTWLSGEERARLVAVFRLMRLCSTAWC